MTRPALCTIPALRSSTSCCIAPGKQSQKKKGPPGESTGGPSLGRKRPRRAAIARGATAPQQYATALHKTQGLSDHFPRVLGVARRAPERRISPLFSEGYG